MVSCMMRRSRVKVNPSKLFMLSERFCGCIGRSFDLDFILLSRASCRLDCV